MLLLSGGVDSTCCLSFLTSAGKSVDCVFVNYGQPAVIAESNAAAEVAQHFGCDLRIVRINSDRKFNDGEILGRNAALIFAALLSCETPPASICIGIHSGTQYFDCTESFLSAIDRLVAESSDGRTRVVAPFITWEKIDLIRFAIDNRVPVNQTYSCEAGNIACGRCLSCKDRTLIACS